MIPELTSYSISLLALIFFAFFLGFIVMLLATLISFVISKAFISNDN